MSRIFVAADLPTASIEARDEVVAALTKVSKYSKENEPGVQRYMICVPADSADSTTVWALEVYADKETLDAHMASEPVKELISLMSTKPVLAGAPTIRQLSFVEGMDFTKAEVSQQSEPHVVFADIEYSAGEKASALEHWGNFVHKCKGESGCFAYGLASDGAKPDTLYTLEVYESEKYVSDVHAKSSAVQELLEKTKGSLKGVQHTRLQLRGGFVAK